MMMTTLCICVGQRQMSQPASEHNLLYLWKFVGETPQELSFEDSMKIEASYRENPAKPVKLGSLTLNLKNKTAYNASSNNCRRLERVCAAWSVFWNQKWCQLPWELNSLLSTSYHCDPAAGVEANGLFRQPGTYLFNFTNMTVTDVSHNNATLELKLAEKELFDDFTADFPTLMAEGAKEVRITVKDARASFQPLASREYNVQPFTEKVAAKPLNEVILSKVHLTRPTTLPRGSLGSSYSDKWYRWVWDSLGPDTKPTAALPGVQLRNIIFVNNPSMMQDFRAAVEKLDVPNDWPACPVASMLESVCSEHEFLFSLKSRVALVMHVTDDYRECAILSCGFSAINAEDTDIGKGIPFTSDAEYAKGNIADRFKAVGATSNALGSGCIVLSWVAIGKPYFTQKLVSGRQAGYTTHFALTNNGRFVTVNGATLDTPILVSFEPELCCPFAVCEFDLVYPPTGA